MTDINDSRHVLAKNTPAGATLGNLADVWIPSDIKKAGERMVEGFEMLEKAWNLAETILAVAHVPHDVEVKIGDTCYSDDTRSDWHEHHLGYLKRKGEWRICVTSVFNSFDNFGNERIERMERRITDCPVEMRLEMLDHFQQLYDAVIQATKDYVPKIQSKVAAFSSTIQLMDL